MSETPFAGKSHREDVASPFPADLVDSDGPALIAEAPPMVAALVGARLVQLAAHAGGTRVKLSAVERAITLLERGLTKEACAHCTEEAKRIARWCVDTSESEPTLSGDRLVMSAEIESRISVIRWAIEQGLDLELEWYDAIEDRWPRRRASPVRVDDSEEPTLVLATELAEIDVPIADLRWVMPVERRAEQTAKVARVLRFPASNEEE